MTRFRLPPILTIIFVLTLNWAWASDNSEFKNTFKSEIFGAERSFYIKLPTSYKLGSEDVYPVIYLLDEDIYIEHFFNVMDHLSSGGIAPEFIIVGIEHKSRIRDLTPTPVEGRSDSGGADKFLQYIEQELIPHIDKQYQTNGFEILAGHSFGGLFTLHAMQAKPDLFNAHFAFSPSLYWDNQTTVKSVKAFLKSNPKYRNYLYINMGNEGLEDPYDNSIGMRDGYMELVKFIEQNAPDKFRFASNHMEEEYHMSTIVVGPFYALRDLYRKFPLPTAKIKLGLNAILQHQEALSEEVGTKITANEGRIYYAGMYHMWANEDLNKGIEILQYNIKLHPLSDWSHDGLAQLYIANGELNKALKHNEMSLKHGDPKSDNYQEYTKRHEEIQKLLQKPD